MRERVEVVKPTGEFTITFRNYKRVVHDKKYTGISTNKHWGRITQPLYKWTGWVRLNGEIVTVCVWSESDQEVIPYMLYPWSLTDDL